MALNIATYNLAADRQRRVVARRAYRRLLRRARVIATQEPETLVRSGGLNSLPGKVVTVPAVKEFDRRPFLYKPGAGLNKVELFEVYAHNIKLEHGWPRVGWHARALLPCIVVTDPATKQPFLMVNMHLLHRTPKGSARADANDRIIDALIDLADSRGLPTVALGDWNRHPDHPGNDALREAGFTIYAPGGTHGRGLKHTIDYAAVRGVQVRSGTVLKGYPGDHAPVLFRIHVPKQGD